MSRKHRENNAVNAAAVPDDSDRHLQAVADDPGQKNAPSTEDKVRTALADNPGSTTAKLAMAAGVGRSTAAKILARWGREGTVIRTAGDGPRNPDTWTPAPSNRDITTAPVTDDARPDATAATPSTDQPNDHASDTDDDTTAEQTGSTEETATEVDDSTAEDTTAAEGPATTSEADDNNAATDTTDDTPTPPTDTDAVGTTPPPGTAPMDPVGSATGAVLSLADAPAVADTTDTAPTDKDRLRKGGLRALVEEYLTAHPGESFGPAKIGKDLVRSGGAVNNALEKLVADGYAIKTCEAPKRFAINPDKTDVPDTANDTE